MVKMLKQKKVKILIKCNNNKISKIYKKNKSKKKKLITKTNKKKEEKKRVNIEKAANFARKNNTPICFVFFHLLGFGILRLSFNNNNNNNNNVSFYGCKY